MHTYASIYLHVVFATWSRRPFLTPSLRPRVHAYIATTARSLGVADVHVGGYDDGELERLLSAHGVSLEDAHLL